MTNEVELFLDAYPEMDNVELGQPATEDDIVAFEKKYQIKLPADMQDYVLMINGIYEGGCFVEVESLDKWCSLAKYIKRWPANYGIESTAGYYWFGHYDFGVWEWVIKLSDDPHAETPVYVLYNGMRKIADNFGDFLRQYREQGSIFFFAAYKDKPEKDRQPSEVDTFRKDMKRYKDIWCGDGASDNEIVAFERRYNITLPADVREYFLKINGNAEGGFFIELLRMDEWSTMTEYSAQWWPNDEQKYPENYFRFGHYDISVWEWVIALNSDPEAETPVFVWTDGFKKIADNFSNFLYKYRTRGSETLLGYDD